jgi:hypothetical protein
MDSKTYGQSPSPACSSVVREAIEKRLEELRADCAVKREIKRNAYGRRWALAGGNDASSQKYWDDRQAAAQEKSTLEVDAADMALVEFIAEHRPLMGSDWIGNDHGRLCWSGYLGGMPINQHYCQREENHDGNCADEWPETKWVFRDRRGSWPKGCSNSREVHEQMDRKNDPSVAVGRERPSAEA